MDLTRLKEPFRPWEIEWRIGRAGKNNKGIWAKVLAYITSRAIMDRLDEVCGPGNWQTAFNEGGGHLHAGLGIKIDDEWVWKWDGTGQLDASGGLSATDAGKGDFSNALKRVAVQWGIGRYLYGLDEGWATVHDGGEHYAHLPKDKGGDSFRWDPPELPSWALPDDMGEAPEEDGPRTETILAIHNSLDQLDTLNEERGEKARDYYKANADAIKATEESARKFLAGLEDKVIEEKSNTKRKTVPA